MKSKYKKTAELLGFYQQLYGEAIVKIIGKANRHILMNLTDGMVAGLPQPATLLNKKVWSVPILLTAKTGATGEVGVIFIDDENHDVLGATDTSMVMHNAEMLINEKVEVA